MLRILGRANSINVRKVLWICDELGLPSEREDWGRGFRPTDDPEFMSVNPIGLIPAIVEDGIAFRESNTIVRYLASKYGPPDIYPADPVKRAHAEQWMDWVNYETSISLRGAFLGGQLNEPPWNNPWFIDQCRRDITMQIGQLDTHLADTGPYVAGANFTVGDIPVGVVVNRWFCLEFDRPDYAAVRAYYEKLTERPPYRRHVRNGLP